MPDQETDKAPLSQAVQGICAGILSGAQAGEQAFPAMRLASVSIILNDQVRFAKDGSPLLDTDEPGTRPVQIEIQYERAPEKPQV